MSSRKLNALEQKLHQAALASTNKTLTQKEFEALAPDATARTAALNFLLGTAMLKVLKNTKGTVSIRAVLKKELDVKKDMSGEETMVLSHIQASANEGIWTKHLKAKTELHQTVIDRCLKALVQKQLIKVVKSVKHPTRKIFMMSHLEPSVEMTGGPWYTDNELDTEFIKLLSSACLHYIKDRSFPKQKRSQSQSSQPLYPLSAAPSYPTAEQVQMFLSKSKITETILDVEHVEMLLHVLILDGEIEKVPAFGAALWESTAVEQESDTEKRGHKKKRKHKEEKGRDSSSKKRRRKHSNDDSDDEEEEDRVSNKKKKKKRKVDEESGSEDGAPLKSPKKKKKKAAGSDSDSDSDTDSELKQKSKKKSSKKSKYSSPPSSSSSSCESSPAPRKRFTSPPSHMTIPEAEPDMDHEHHLGGSYVYRAIRQEKVLTGWSQAPCGRCPVFDFCKDKGPVNPTECTYYGEWLARDVVAAE